MNKHKELENNFSGTLADLKVGDKKVFGIQSGEFMTYNTTVNLFHIPLRVSDL